jgi:tetratricopeptide (TPR) repeat protein
MQENIQYIDDFFQGKLSKEEVSQFEDKIVQDRDFAESVAFYLSAKQTAKEQVNEEKKTRYKEIYTTSNGYHHPKVTQGKILRIVLTAAVAASVAAIVVIQLLTPSSPQLAEKYIGKELNKISVTMGPENEIQIGLKLYNEGNYSASRSQFESIIRKDSSVYPAFEYAGLASLQLSDYEKALYYFKRLEQYPGLFSNRGVFLHALTLLKRNQKGDVDEAESLLKRVVAENLEGKETAEKWLKKI